ncbi:tautomerase family protein [Nocardia alba]|uniref:Tautomerase n=1 Tax=Nocardia alba TaxID=225051 RepID=A0A4R1FF98_9NOCA|nr:4-oxalocrotonate tautomerase family protein [Nocardia alba]TCJ89561.1 4-oxalocrotonate tautomerase [Nocardia alba]
MPYVNIKVTDEGVTTDQKAQLIRGVTDLLREVLGKAPDSTYVVIDEVPLTDWGVGGVNVTEYRARRAATE